jgi:hypothetical protein
MSLSHRNPTYAQVSGEPPAEDEQSQTQLQDDTSLISNADEESYTSSNPKKLDSRRRARPISTNFQTWWKEIAAVIVPLATAVGTFVTLYTSQDKPLLEWPLEIAIGALLSIYVVLLKRAMALA